MTTFDAQELSRKMAEAAAHGLTLSAEYVRGRTIPLTPLEDGDLRNSLTVVPASPDDLEAAVVSDLAYAVVQHEDLTFRHDDGGPKFLEIASLAAIPAIEQILATAANRVR